MASETPFLIYIYSFHLVSLPPLFTGVLDAEDFQFLFVEADAAEHQAVAAQSLDGVDAHAAHHLADLMTPGGEQVNQAFGTDVRIQAFYQFGALGCNAPVALAVLAGAAQMAAERQQGSRCDINRIRAECNRLDDICGVADGAADDDGDIVADALVAQALVDRCERKLNRDTDVVADAGSRRWR